MKTVDIPGGQATFREQGVDRVTGRQAKILRAAALAAATAFDGLPEILFGGPDDETDAQRDERVRKALARQKQSALTIEQAMTLDNSREAAVVALLESWTLDEPLPTLDTIGELDSDLYDALVDYVGGVSSMSFNENFSVQPKVDNSTPTDDCGSSSGSSSTDPQSSPLQTPSSDIPAIAGESSSLEQSSTTSTS